MMTEIDPLRLAQDLIRCPSVTPKDAGALDVLHKALESLGFTCHRLPFGDGEARVDNLYARLGTREPNFCFAGHTDVVPPGELDQWTIDPFKGAVQDGYLIGRGASDMKGAIAAFVAAVSQYLRNNGQPSGSISLLITGDEEGPADFGTKKVLDWLNARGERINHCMVGEPTSAFTLGDTVKNGRRGSLNAWLTIKGIQGHVAYPHRADNPVPRLIRFIDAVQSRVLDEGSEGFDPSNLEITDIAIGNEAVNIIPASAHVRLNIRFNDVHTGQSLKTWLEGMARTHAGDHDLTVRISGDAFYTEPGAFSSILQEAVEGVTGTRPELSTTGGTSDARFITHMCPVVELGLLGTTMHKVNEAVKVDDIETLSRIYEGVLARYFASGFHA